MKTKQATLEKKKGGLKYDSQLQHILGGSEVFLSDIKPSDWCELHRHMSTEVTPFPGQFSYERTPYWREVVDNLSPYSAARVIAIMKGAQLGFSVGVIEAGIGWIIAENPGNILSLSGHQQLSEESMNQKIDVMIDACGIRHLIRPHAIKKKNNRTGDTAKSKEFPGGSLVAGSASNHALLAQRSIQYGFVDDYDDVKGSSKTDGSTTNLIEGRFASYFAKMKLYYGSTPRVESTSNIKPLYLKGDQRKWMVPCPCCGVHIELFWSMEVEGSKRFEQGGITWKLDSRGKLLPESVGYICQECGDFFTDSDKGDWLPKGYWQPTAESSQPGYVSYHISSLYAPVGAYDWEHYVRKYLEANPPNGDRDEEAHQTFLNLNLGLTYEPKGNTPKANDLQKNVRNYGIGTIPNKLSEADGNGRIILLTCACDLNGTVDDARLDWEIVAWSETEASYSVKHGSIGTFVPNQTQAQKDKDDRVKWTYKPGNNSVWPHFQEILNTKWPLESGKTMKIIFTTIDTGHYSQYAYTFIDRMNEFVVGIKGDKENQFRRIGIDMPLYKHARERNKLFILDVNHIKDQIATDMVKKWDTTYGDAQPPWFMNYPLPSDGLYLYNNFFSHYEAESRIEERKEGRVVGSKWMKKNSAAQNHCWDLRVYNIAAKEIFVDKVLAEMKKKDGTWGDFVKFATGKK